MSHGSDQPDMITAMQQLIDHPATPKHERDAAEAHLRRFKDKKTGATRAPAKKLPCIDCHPEAHGLETIGEVSWTEERYEYDVTVLFYDRKTREYLLGSDSGCSCPHPFEGQTRADLDPVKSINELQAYLHALAGGPRVDNRQVEAEITELLERVRKRRLAVSA